MYGHSTLAHMPNSNFLGSAYNDVDTGRSKVGNNIAIQDKNEIMFDLRSEDFARNKDAVPEKNEIMFDLRSEDLARNKDAVVNEEQCSDRAPNLLRVHDLEGEEGSVNERENVPEGSDACYVPSSEVKLSHTETEFYTDKSVTECELPKLIACVKEGDHHVVKDICIDEGLPSTNSNLHENCEMPQKELLACKDVNSELTKDTVPTATPISDGIDTPIKCEHKADVANKCESDHLLQSSEGKIEVRDGDPLTVSDEKANLEGKISAEECTNGFHSHNEPSNLGGNEDQQQSEQATCEEAQPVGSMVLSGADELNNVNQGSKLPVISEMEGASFRYDFDSMLPTTSGRDGTQNADCQKPVQTFNMLCHEEDMLDSQTASSRSFYIQHGHGESSFSSVGPLSGPIPYSGHVPYSGSISLRSDSSTTSTRSFAFPVMHTEWNSSPVKMAKADRRHLRKHRGWRTSLLCCRF